MIKPIPGYELFSISDDGVVFYNGIEKKVSTNKLGYKKASILGNNIRVHRLVAMVFIGDIKGKVVMHLDDNPSNNCVSNLKIGTQKENMRDMFNKGRNNFQKKSIVNEEIIDKIRAGVQTKHIVEMYGIHSNTVYFWKKRLGMNTHKRNRFETDKIKEIINEKGSNVSIGKKYGVCDMTIHRWKLKYG